MESILTGSTSEIEETEFSLLRSYVEKNCGIVIDEEKVYLIESRLAKLVVETGSSDFNELYQKLNSNSIPGLRDKIIDAMTTNETLWFRDRKPFEILGNNILPGLVKQERTDKYRIWSCACSTGQEPYSIAMVINEFCERNPSLGLSLEKFEIIASDISPSVLFIASNGRYDNLAMRRGMEDYYKNKYFTQDGPVWSISDNIKKYISFRKINLQDPFNGLGVFDLIFCRNVIIYFSDKFKRELFIKFARSLDKNGFFFLGSAETTFGYTDNYERFNVNNGIYYKIKSGGLHEDSICR